MQTVSGGVSRRFFLKNGWLPFAAGIGGSEENRWISSVGSQSTTSEGADVYRKLGVKPIINALGTATRLGGSLMPPEVVAAMERASRHFVPLPEVHERVGRRIAELIGVEAALVTSGAAGAITLGTAACVKGGDRERIRRLPDTKGMKNEVIVQKSHCCGYMAQVRLVGARVIPVETTDELEKALSPKTAMLFFVNTLEEVGRIGRREWVALGKKWAIPTFNDAAADVPPKNRLSEYVHMGFDLVAFSGGKGLFGPQCSGLLLGRNSLVEAARLNGSPHAGIGRGMKVGKEEMIGLLAAVERFLTIDQEVQWREWKRRVAHIGSVLTPIRGVQAELYVPPIANHVPHLALRWDPDRMLLKPAEVSRRLLHGEPPIEVAGTYKWSSHPPLRKDGLTISVWTLQPGETRVATRRLREILAGAT